MPLFQAQGDLIMGYDSWFIASMMIKILTDALNQRSIPDVKKGISRKDVVERFRLVTQIKCGPR